MYFVRNPDPAFAIAAAEELAGGVPLASTNSRRSMVRTREESGAGRNDHSFFAIVPGGVTYQPGSSS